MKDTGLTVRTATRGFDDARPASTSHMLGLFDMRGANWETHHQSFATPSGESFELWWLTEDGRVTEIYEDTRGLNRR